MSKWYPCVYCTEDLKCTKNSGDGVISFCVLGPCHDETPSNADRLRALSDEELAEFMGTLPCCPPGVDVIELCGLLDSCEGTDLQVKCWLKWLRQEATS